MRHTIRYIIVIFLLQLLATDSVVAQRSKSVHIMPVRAFYTLNYLPIPSKGSFVLNQFSWYYKMQNPHTKAEYNEYVQEMFYKHFSPTVKSAKAAKKIYSLDNMTSEQIQAEEELFLRTLRELDFTLKNNEKFNPNPLFKRSYSHNMAPLIYEATGGDLPDYICFIVCHAYSTNDSHQYNVIGKYRKEPRGDITIKAIFIETKTATIVDYLNVSNSPFLSHNRPRKIDEKKMKKAITKFVKKFTKQQKELS